MIKKYDIVFATGNRGKIKEIQMILEDLECNIITMKDAGIDIDIIEDGITYEENSFSNDHGENKTSLILMKVSRVVRCFTKDLYACEDA